MIPPLGVEAVARLLRAPEPLNLPPRAPLDARTANSSPLIVVGALAMGHRVPRLPTAMDHVELIVLSLTSAQKRF